MKLNLNRFFQTAVVNAVLCLATSAHALDCDKMLRAPNTTTLFAKANWVAQVQVLEIIDKIPETKGFVADAWVKPIHYFKYKNKVYTPNQLPPMRPLVVRFESAPTVGGLYHVFVTTKSDKEIQRASDKTWAVPHGAGASCKVGSAEPGEKASALLFTGKAGLVVSFGGKNTPELHQFFEKEALALISGILPNGQSGRRYFPPARWTEKWGWAIQINNLPAGKFAVEASPFLNLHGRSWEYSHPIVEANKDTNGGNCGANPMLDVAGANRICDKKRYFIELKDGETRSAVLNPKSWNEKAQ